MPVHRPKIPKRIGESIRKYRKQKNYTVTHLAIELKISRGYLCYLESGGRRPSALMAKKLAKFFDADVGDFI